MIYSTYVPVDRVIVHESATAREVRLVGVCQDWISVRVARGRSARLTWRDVRAAAEQSDATLAAPYRAILAAADAAMSTRSTRERQNDLVLAQEREATKHRAAGRYVEAAECDRTAAEIHVSR